MAADGDGNVPLDAPLVQPLVVGQESFGVRHVGHRQPDQLRRELLDGGLERLDGGVRAEVDRLPAAIEERQFGEQRGQDVGVVLRGTADGRGPVLAVADPQERPHFVQGRHARLGDPVLGHDGRPPRRPVVPEFGQHRPDDAVGEGFDGDSGPVPGVNDRANHVGVRDLDRRLHLRVQRDGVELPGRLPGEQLR